MKVLVVTGGIGSGKSLICRILEDEYGIPVYDADSRAKMLYMSVPSMLDSIEMSVGAKVRTSDGKFVPQMLAEVIFNDSDALKKVEDILFPVMKSDFIRWAGESECDVVAFESATILEKLQFDGFGDIVLLVNAPVDLRLSRAMARDGACKEKILARIQAQPLMNRLSDSAEDSRVDYVLDNSSSEEDLRQNLKEFMIKYGLTKML